MSGISLSEVSDPAEIISIPKSNIKPGTNTITAIEIGTSDFEFIDTPADSKVILVEPIPFYLESAIDQAKKAGKKPLGIEAAVYPHDKISEKESKVYFFDPELAHSEDHPQWLRGVNMIDVVHPEIVEYCKQKELDLDKYLRSKTISKITFTQLIEKADEHFGPISDIGIIKTDTEGQDTYLILSIVHELSAILRKTGRNLFPTVFQFEVNYLNQSDRVKLVINVLREHGYTLMGYEKGNAILRKFT